MITIIHRPTKYIDKAIFVDKVLNDEQHLKLYKLTKPRGLYIWIPIMLLFWTLLFFCAIASADEVKITADYAKHYPYTVSDVKRTYSEEGEPIEYIGVDKDNPARFSMWCE